MTEFWSCWVRPNEVIEWKKWGLGFEWKLAGYPFEDLEGWMKFLGIEGIRIGAPWIENELQPGVYDFETSYLADSMRRLQKVGLKVYMNPTHPAPAWCMEPSRDPRLPAGTMIPIAEKFEAYIRALATKYPYVKLWGFGNENDAKDDPIGGLADSAFGGDWRIPAETHYYTWLVPFARAVRSVIPDAVIAGPGTMTYGYAETILLEDNKQPVRSLDMVDVHGYAMNGLFPGAALSRLEGDADSLEVWMTQNGARATRQEIIGEVGIEHIEDRGEKPEDLLVYLRGKQLNRFKIVTLFNLYLLLTNRTTEKPRSLEPNALYFEVRDLLAEMKRKHRAVRS